MSSETLSPEELEIKIQSLEDQLVVLRRDLRKYRLQRSQRELPNYFFRSIDDVSVSLLDLFGDKDELILIQNMGSSCNYCSLWADELNGMQAQLQTHAALAVISGDEWKKMADFRSENGWQFPMYSSAGTTFKMDTGFELKDQSLMPGVMVLRKMDEKIFWTNTAYFGPGDDYSSIWNYFDLLEKGSKGWQPIDRKKS